MRVDLEPSIYCWIFAKTSKLPPACANNFAIATAVCVGASAADTVGIVEVCCWFSKDVVGVK